jgi:glycosyltransferase involved in cell wall biosynthesis
LPWEPVDPELVKQIPAETTIYPAPYLTSRIVRRGSSLAAWRWLPQALRACDRAIRAERPAALLTSGPPQEVHWLGLWLKRRHRLPWVADFRNLWCPNGQLGHGHGRCLAAWRIGVQGAAVIAAADAVIASTPGACAHLRATYPRHRGKFVTLPNGYDQGQFAALATSILPRLPGSPVRIVHAGAISGGRDPRPFFDAVKNLADGREPLPLAADFYGPSAPPESSLDLAREIATRGLGDRVMVHGHVPYARALRAMAEADVLLLLNSPGRAVGVPAKLYEYIGAGRPVLALGERGGDLACVLEQSGIPHRIVPPGDPAAIASALGELAAIARATPARLRGDQDRFSREAIAGRLAHVLDRCAGRRAGQGTHAPIEPAFCAEARLGSGSVIAAR